jgi:phenol 2-monooxygenase
MNVSMADAWNLGWKLGTVLRGTARPELLHTYSAERQVIAQELIDFDREFAAMFSAAPEEEGGDGVDPAEFQRYFVRQGRFTAGVATRYAPSMITAAAPRQELARGFVVGMRFHSAPVIRVADAKRVQLGHAARADGAWRLYVFTGADGAPDLWAPLEALVARYPELDVLAIFPHHHHDIAIDELPSVLLPRKGRFGLIDYEKVFSGPDIFDLREIDRAGCMVVTRPDQYVAHVLGLDAHEALADFLGGVLISRQSPSGCG